MTSITEQRPDGSVIYRAASTRTVPSLDVLTLLFESEHSGGTEDAVVHADAADPSKAITKSQLRVLIKRTASTFRTEFGIGADGPDKDVVLAIASGHFLLPNVFFAAIAADGIFSAVGPSSTPGELARAIEQVEAKLLVCTPDTRETAVAAAKLANLSLWRVLVLGAGHEFELTEAVPSTTTTSPSGKGVVPFSSEPLEWRRIEDPKALEESIICILFSSGTTGVPKGVKMSHANFVAEACLTTDPVREWHRQHMPSFKMVTLAHLPAAHVAGVVGYFVMPMYYDAGTVYWMPRFDFPLFLEHSRRHRVTFFFSVPPIYVLISKSPLVGDHFDALEYVATGAAPMGKETQRAVGQRLGRGRTQLVQTYGLSETTGSITVMPRHLQDDTGSVSPLLPNSCARIVDEDGRDVRPGESGEVWVKSPVVTKGYYKNPDADREAFRDGWFCTGDIGHFRDGLLYIVDRKKELIKYKGNQVAPAELEALLITHPKILDAAVIGVQMDGTEVPRAYVVADPKQTGEREITEWVAKQVSNHKKLRGGVVYLNAIPKTPSGKILRKELRELAKRETKAKL